MARGVSILGAKANPGRAQGAFCFGLLFWWTGVRPLVWGVCLCEIFPLRIPNLILVHATAGVLATPMANQVLELLHSAQHTSISTYVPWRTAAIIGMHGFRPSKGRVHMNRG